MNERRRQRYAFARRLGSAVVSQALLSAASFGVGLLLIRHASDAQYGAYVLATGAILLLASLQGAFVAPPLAVRLARAQPVQRGALVGGLYVAQRRVFAIVGAMFAAAVVALWLARVWHDATALLLGITVLALGAILHREYFRIVLYVRGRSLPVLRADVVYAALALAGAFAAIHAAAAATWTLAALGTAALASALLLARATRRDLAWTARSVPGLLREIAPLAAWSVAGAGIHWTFSQGYIYLVAATLDVSAVAAIAATRMLLMPVNMLSGGIGTQMLPVAALWLHRHGHAVLMRRLAGLALAVAVACLVYFGLLWWGREWVFDVLLRKRFPQRDSMLLLWGAIFLVMVARDQLAFGITAQGRFRALSLLTLACAAVSLAAGYAGMLRLGVAGALAGLLAGECVSLLGVVALLPWRRAPSALSATA
jgi:O-antigen/teichoic acid export membrane protein